MRVHRRSKFLLPALYSSIAAFSSLILSKTVVLSKLRGDGAGVAILKRWGCGQFMFQKNNAQNAVLINCVGVARSYPAFFDGLLIHSIQCKSCGIHRTYGNS